jgi:hypothetical protein
MLKKIALTVALFALTTVSAIAVLVAIMNYTKIISPLGSLFVSTSSWDQGFVLAKGSWMMLNDRINSPMQTSEIRCVRVEGTCHEAIAKIFNDDYLSVELYRRQIVSWTSKVISYDDTAECVKVRYSIDRDLQQIVGRRQRIEPSPPGCEHFTKDLQLVMRDGFTAWREETERRRPIFALLLAEAIVLCVAVFFAFRIWRRRPALA